MVISIVAIDDEPLSLARLNRLSQKIEGAELVASGDSGLRAIELAKNHSPDVMLLDINMPNMNGLEAATRITKMLDRPPAIIFCTAYDEHGIEAFKSNAVGYLLKPIQFSELKSCVLNAKKINSLQLNNLSSAVSQPITISTFRGNSRELIAPSDIAYFRAEGKSVLASVDKEEIIIDYTLKSLEQVLDDTFLRVHKNALVNRCKLSRMDMGGEYGPTLYLRGGKGAINVSRRHLTEVKKCFG